MLTGDHPFDEWNNNDEVALFEAITDRDHKPLPADRVSADARNWIDQLLVKDPTLRLGRKQGEESALLKHPWLSNMRMKALRRRAVHAPWKPHIANHHDSSFFDDWDHLDPVVKTDYPQLTGREAARFDKFDKV